MAGTPKARALGRALRQAREDKKLTRRELGAKLNRDHGVISRWETAERTPRPDQVAQLLTVLGVNGERYDEIIALAYDNGEPSWVATTVAAQRQQLTAYVDLVEKATRIVQVEPLLVPGLLQTDGYIRAVMADGLPPDESAARTAIRVGLRAVLKRPELTAYLALIGEAALYQQVGGPDVLRDQLRYLIASARHPKVELRILPFRTDWHPALDGPFVIVDAERSRPMVHLEGRTQSLLVSDAAVVTEYQRAAERVCEVALTAEESIAYIVHNSRQDGEDAR
ncbi:helix-turn-helix domain-containing protein [Gandjariella thermophila]|uniref:HTH cro/C1-type domain-containing protein n=1 Tax=Gandjariella thermophila TaxID=1931992 RepID=A0A4D4JBA4_9PSEU|nr:helix-turn-helix transcriptional regulator [Gandjariella thermophila]GDY31716.1 hypothetical protein GTS_33490 [Gandjariella thermophila]